MEADISGIVFIDDMERQYFEEARLGEQVRAFLVSPAGRYLHGRAKLQLEEVKEKLLDLDPRSSESAAKDFECAKLDAKTAQSFMRWCSDAINNGEQAYQQLQNQEDLQD